MGQSLDLNWMIYGANGYTPAKLMGYQLVTQLQGSGELVI
ncbi:FAD dependent oxidoreductase domain-containing protein [Acinetobacter bereziniae]|uniref:Uncharacterized protein n=1 Tax=Acinetobacter bereziniae NIPH 3 TaxID=1217651 RepID=N8YTY6_ACIBZ|nr:hypothetical protein F963_01326 [Acinetobacter bereziniae NIPH 3]